MNIIDPNDPSLRGGVQLQRVPVIPWDKFCACAVKVYKEDKVQAALFDPQPMETAEEAFQTLRFLLAAQGAKPGPAMWTTLPECVQRHFSFEGDSHVVPT